MEVSLGVEPKMPGASMPEAQKTLGRRSDDGEIQAILRFDAAAAADLSAILWSPTCSACVTWPTSWTSPARTSLDRNPPLRKFADRDIEDNFMSFVF